MSMWPLDKSSRVTFENDYAETHVIDESCYILICKMKRFVPKAYWDSLGWN